HAAGAVVDGQALASGMATGRLDVLDSWVEPRHLRSQPRQGFTDDPAAAAHVEHAQALEWTHPALRASEVAEHFVTQEAEPGRPDFVQGAELPPRVPPLGGQARKPLDFLGVERFRRRAWGTLLHGELAPRAEVLSSPAPMGAPTRWHQPSEVRRLMQQPDRQADLTPIQRAIVQLAAAYRLWLRVRASGGGRD